MEKVLQITKAPIAKIWHVLKAKAIAALEKYVSVSTFGSSIVGLSIAFYHVDDQNCDINQI